MKLEQHDLDWLEKMLFHMTGNSFTEARSQLLLGKLKQAATVNAYQDVPSLIAALRHEKNITLREQVVATLLNHETMFFRDTLPFAFLQEEGLPTLMANQSGEKTITLWSAGCSFGQEAYSLAMLLQKKFSHVTDWQFQILASDVSSVALQRAKDAVYTYVEVHRGLSAEDRKRFFIQQQEMFQLKSSIRQQVTFHQFALNQPWPPWPPCDVVFLRNVLLYCSAQVKHQILSRVKKILRPGSYLVLGNAEFLPWQETSFVRCKRIGSMYCYLQDNAHHTPRLLREDNP